MDPSLSIPLEHYHEAAAAVRERTSQQPEAGLILGSGLGTLVEEITNADIIPYAEIPHWPRSTVVGHAGRLVIGELEGRTVLAMQGRSHFYEGYPMSLVTLPVRVMRLLGIDTLIVTNAAGGLNPSFHAGDIMVIEDHINIVGMAGNSPCAARTWASSAHASRSIRARTTQPCAGWRIVSRRKKASRCAKGCMSRWQAPPSKRLPRCVCCAPGAGTRSACRPRTR